MKKNVSKPFKHVISHLKTKIVGEICLKTGDFGARDILVAPQCKLFVVALQEYFKFNFGAVLVIISTLNEL